MAAVGSNPLWVTSGHSAMSAASPLYPVSGHSGSADRMAIPQSGQSKASGELAFGPTDTHRIAALKVLDGSWVAATLHGGHQC